MALLLCGLGRPAHDATRGLIRLMASPMRGSCHGAAVTDEVASIAHEIGALHGQRLLDNTRLLSYAVIGRCATAGGWLHHPKGGDSMQLTYTFRIGKFTISIVIRKRDSRHSAK